MRRTALSLALVSVLTLGACGGEANPVPAPLTKTPSVSPSVSPVPPARPASAAGVGKRSARSLVVYYLRALSYASVTGDVTLVKSLGTSDCASCNGAVDEIRRTYAAGGRVQGTKISVTAFAYVRTTANGFRIQTTIESAPETSFASPSSSPSRNPGGSSGLVFTLIKSNDHLLISGWTQAT